MKTVTRMMKTGVLLLSLCALKTASAQDANLIANGDFSQGQTKWDYDALGTQNTEMNFIEASPTPDIKKALHVEVKAEEKLRPWSVRLTQKLNRAVKAGDVLKVSFWARSPGSNILIPNLETSATPVRGFLYKRLTLSPEWKKYEAQSAAKEDTEAGQSQATFHFALAAGTIEITGIQIENQSAAPAATTPATPAAAPSTPAPAPSTPVAAPSTPGATPGASAIANGDFSQGKAKWDYNALGTQDPMPNFVDASPAPEIKKALHVEVKDEEKLRAWSVRLTQKLNRAIKTGDELKISFWARSPGNNTIGAVLESTDQSQKGLVNKRITLSPEWKKYEVLAKAKEDFVTAMSQVTFHISYGPGVVEITGIEVTPA